MTAVEWLADEIIILEEKLRLEEININDFMDAKDELVSKALEMEKEKEEQYNNMLSMLQETHRRLEPLDTISLRKQIKEVLTFKSE